MFLRLLQIEKSHDHRYLYVSPSRYLARASPRQREPLSSVRHDRLNSNQLQSVPKLWSIQASGTLHTASRFYLLFFGSNAAEKKVVTNSHQVYTDLNIHETFTT